MNYLITGVSGFAGRALKHRLLEAGHTVYGLSRNPGPSTNPPPETASRYFHLQADLTDAESLKSRLKDLPLDFVFHLAAQSSVKTSWEQPAQTYQANVQGTAALVDALKARTNLPRLLLVSSGEVYGALGGSNVCRESNPLDPQNPYALSKRFSEEIVFRFYKENAIVVRPFSHLGPGQSEQFAIPNFCRQISEMRNAAREPVLSVGNIRVTRSVTALGDVLDAYLLLTDKGSFGEAYNVAGNLRATLEEMLLILKELSGVNFSIRVDPLRLRPSESAEAPVVNCQKLKTLGWAPKTGLRDLLKQVWQTYEN